MKAKFGWILFSIMTVAAIVLSSVLISYDLKWKSGEEILDFDVKDVKSAYLYHNILASAQPETRKYDLSGKEIEYIVTEFRCSKFERTNNLADSGAGGVVFMLKDGSQREFYTVGGIFTIDGKKYECHSYLGRYIAQYVFDKIYAFDE